MSHQIQNDASPDPDSLTGRSGASVSEVIQSTARAAGELVIGRYHDQGRIDVKGRGNIVSEVDRASEELISSRLLDEFPDFAFLGEESGLRPGDDEWQWIADPIDGTRNFVSHLPNWCLMVSLAHRGRPIAGATYDPLRDEMFYGQIGQRTTLNGQPVAVTDKKSVDECVIGMDLGYDDELAMRVWGVIGAVFPGLQAIRVLGSTGLGMAYLAAGRVDLYFCAGGNPWDIASGVVLIDGASGVTSDRHGNPVTMPSEAVIGASPEAHADFLRITERLPFRKDAGGYG
ncbi:MAG: inositol monophosphatase family protein [Chloroflexi bacterium]|nr:inositol monophosphatase family protein [Chloroflexota bacterium]